MILASSILGQIGERVIAYFEEFGNVQGSVIRVNIYSPSLRTKQSPITATQGFACAVKTAQ